MSILSKAEVKRERVLKALNHEEPDKVPITDFFWTQFINNWIKEKGLDKNVDIYRYYDLDLLVVNPNMDPKIKKPEIIKRDEREIIYKSGWGSVVKMSLGEGAAMPGYLDFSIKSADDYEKFEFDDPRDDRRYNDIRQDLINMGDNFSELPSYMDAVKAYKEDFCLFGGVCEPNEVLTRARGMSGHFMDIMLSPGKLKAFAERATDFMIEIGRQQLERVAELTGMVIWGDVAYDKGMFYSPDIWRKLYFPCIERMYKEFKKYNVKIIYHGCGNAKEIYNDLIAVGIDCYNPLEVKSGLDVVKLKKEYGKRLAFWGGIDVRVLISGTKEDIKKEILYRLNAAKGGGYIIASDHSVAGNVPPENYEYMVNLVRQYGKYPLELLEGK